MSNLLVKPIMFPRLAFPMGSMPAIIQCGLCTHGTKVRETFRQSRLWSFHYYHYAGEIVFRGASHRFHPGWVSLVPPREEATWIFPSHATHHYVHFRTGGGQRRDVPFLGPAPVSALMDSLPALFEEDPFLAAVRLWDALTFLVSGPPAKGEQGLHPHVQIALSEIRNAGPGIISASAIARKLGVSRSHLTRCFQREMGTGIRAFVRQRKIEQALEMLEASELDIKSIAIECGLPDLPQFNKLIRQSTGLSPREVRTAAKTRHQSPEKANFCPPSTGQ